MSERSQISHLLAIEDPLERAEGVCAVLRCMSAADEELVELKCVPEAIFYLTNNLGDALEELRLEWQVALEDGQKVGQRQGQRPTMFRMERPDA